MGFQVDVVNGRVSPARQVPSPNCDDRPPGVLPELIVVHSISLPPGEYGGPWIDRLFTNSLPPDRHPYFREIAHLEVSTHLLVRRDGSVTQYVPIHQRAWHAGQSCYQGRMACNDFSVGIELEGTDDTAFEPAQYDALAGLITALCSGYPSLSPSRLVGHSDIAPGRKTDPGICFEWQRLHALLGDDAGVRLV
ncbi:MAG TPA: 1,6-anhydro-N-acetylmuramyl-L-alanine amidase AmpD [Steroidobacteraceae bacterium]|nr:1,6-anhydro-N-acetylmuramyl-L-alanine amidase AmpD [Steroidobacteraceae bacterium]